MMKKIILVILLILLSFGAIFVSKGYDMYKEAIEETPLEKKVEEIQSKKNYTKLSELPQTYINAVISVEDHRFYKHHGIDVIAIGRAIINDIKARDLVEGETLDRVLLQKMNILHKKRNLQEKLRKFLWLMN